MATDDDDDGWKEPSVATCVRWKTDGKSDRDSFCWLNGADHQNHHGLQHLGHVFIHQCWNWPEQTVAVNTQTHTNALALTKYNCQDTNNVKNLLP